jgi:peptidoglycan/xylan/chitin deacetylase (PgdA/CDA1 family)
MNYLVKTIMKGAAFKTFSFKPFLTMLRRKALRGRIVALMYHEIADDRDDVESWSVLRKSAFIRQMEYMLENFEIIDTRTALDSFSAGAPAREGRPLSIITFDDGYAGNFRLLLPIVREMKIPVAVFVATGAVRDGTPYWYDRLSCGLDSAGPVSLDLGRFSLGSYRINHWRGARNWQEIGRLMHELKRLAPLKREDVVDEILTEVRPASRGRSFNFAPLSIDEVRGLAEDPLITIGAHSHCHNILTQLEDGEIRESIATSKRLLEEWTGYSVDFFSYPNGNYDQRVIRALKEHGFKCSFTTEERPWDASDDPMTIPRIGVGRYDTFEYFKIRASGLMGSQ